MEEDPLTLTASTQLIHLQDFFFFPRSQRQMPNGRYFTTLLSSHQSESSLFWRGGSEMEQLFRGQIKGWLVKRGCGFLPFKRGASEAGGAVPGPRKWESQEDGYVDHEFFQELYLEPRA